ncbi:extracellular solute-binding protein [Paenibacillus sp. y28]|uniref:extracellular solute-binding protein n=1 Tax=Paenibacillus sp. y28 TaxID=3129110 RepID=UPI00301AE370
MKVKSRFALICAALFTTATIASACGNAGEKAPANQPQSQAEDTSPLNLSIAISQVGDIPNKGNEIEQAIEKYTNTKLDVQWIPSAAYDDKINVMIASNEMPTLLRVKYVPNIINAVQSGLFWEIGPYLKDYKNLSAKSEQFYSNIKVDGKVYGVPIYRNMGRTAVVYRKDWMDALGLQQPKTLDDWYNVVKAMTLQDPDKNGKNDTYGMVLFKKYNEGTEALTTRLAVSQGAPNKYAVDKDGNFTPEFYTKEYNDVLKFYKRLYDEKLLNQDFAVFDATEAEKLFDTNRLGVRIAVATNGKSQQDRLSKNNPNAVVDVMPLEGPNGLKIAAESGNNGFFVIPKSSVKTEAELKRVLKFLDQLGDEQMSTLLLRGIEGKHYAKTNDNRTEFVGDGFNVFQREVKPYRDNLPVLEGYNVPSLKDVAIGEKGTKMESEGVKYIVTNPALNLTSATYSEKGKELEQMIWDAQTKFIMGKIDEAAYQAEIEKWKKAGGEKMLAEYKADYLKQNKK